MGLRDSKLKNDDLLERFYELVIENYDYAGHYLILVFHDAYDVMTKTTDNNKLDEPKRYLNICSARSVRCSCQSRGWLQRG